MRRVFTLFIILALTAGLFPSRTASARTSAPRNPLTPAVLPVTIIKVDEAAAILRSLYPRDKIRIDRAANAIIAVAPADDINGMRTVLSGIDIKNPTDNVIEVEQLHTVPASIVIARVRALFPRARLTPAPNKTLIISASQIDLGQIKTVISAIDTPAATPAPTYPPAEAVRVLQARARNVARAVATSVHGVRVLVSGSELILSGPPEQVAHAKELIAQLDQTQSGVKYTQIYQLRYVDATSVAHLLERSFKDQIQVQVEKDLNALTVSATASVQRRIADAVNQLDGAAGPPQSGAGGGPGIAQPGTTGAAFGSPMGTTEIYRLKAAVPGMNGAASTSASDMATTVMQALSSQAPDLKITVPPNGITLILTGSQYSIKLAKELIAQLDLSEPMVVLDTEVLEVDETVAKNLGVQFSQPVISTSFQESSPVPPLNGQPPPPTLGILPFSRTPLSIGLTLNLLVQNGKARILSDPRITTVSGRTASIRAGDTISILTTAGGGPGTVATTQIQSFQTGVTLDITPVVNAGNFVTVTLHPTVNNLTGILNGVPQISTRDTTTTVGLQADSTLIIGGLIEDTTNRTENKVPIIGELPLIGRLFRNESLNSQRNELIIIVTPHIVEPGNLNLSPGPALPSIPTAQPLPTLPPGTELPPQTRATAPPVLPTEVPEQMNETPPPAVFKAAPKAPPAKVPSTPPPGTPTPGPVPTAFTQTNVFTFGQAPQNNFAKPTDPVQIFYAQVSPTVIKSGSPITVSVITTSNVAKVTFGYGTFATDIPKTAPGQFQATYPFNSAGIPFNTGQVQLLLKAVRADGSTAAIPVGVSVVN